MDREHHEALAALLEDLSDLLSLLLATHEVVRPYEEFLAEIESATRASDNEA